LLLNVLLIKHFMHDNACCPASLARFNKIYW